MNTQFIEDKSIFLDEICKIGIEISNRAKDHYTAGELDKEMWIKLAETGFWKIPVPVKYGGFGYTWKEFVYALESLAKVSDDLGFLLSIIAHAGCIRILLIEGTDSQINRYIPNLVNGAVGATAITESGGGSDVARIKTSAKQIANDKYELSGQKAHITNGPIADIIFIVGRIPCLGKKDITLFVIESECEGVSREKREVMFGNKTSPTGNICLNNVIIYNDNIIGEKGNGLNILYNMISLDRLLYGLISAALSERVLKESLEYAHEREAFKTIIANHQYIQKRIVDIKIFIETSKAVSYSALDKLMNNEIDASLMCSMAKLIGSEGLVNTGLNYLQVNGHKGYMEGKHSKFLKDAVGTLIAGGTSDIQRKNIFHQLQEIYGQGVKQ